MILVGSQDDTCWVSKLYHSVLRQLGQMQATVRDEGVDGDEMLGATKKHLKRIFKGMPNGDAMVR